MDNSDESALIGGKIAEEHEFLATLRVQGNCTASRVGPRHILMAAHCVSDSVSKSVLASFRPGATMMLTGANKVINDKSSLDWLVTIAHTYVESSYFEGDLLGVRVLDAAVASDVALVELTADAEDRLSSVPVAQVDISPVKRGDPIVIMGYGCEVGLTAPVPNARVLKQQATNVISLEDSHFNRPGQTSAALVDNGYFFSPGQRLDPAAASLCPGDSGGPVYRGESGARLVVGVNAYYTFADKNKQDVSVANWHTRFDLASRFDSGSWLASKGVVVVGGTPSSHYDTCLPSRVSRVEVCGSFARAFAEAGGEPALGNPLSAARYDLRAAGPSVWTQVFEKAVLEEHDGKVVRLRRP